MLLLMTVIATITKAYRRHVRMQLPIPTEGWQVRGVCRGFENEVIFDPIDLLFEVDLSLRLLAFEAGDRLLLSLQLEHEPF